LKILHIVKKMPFPLKDGEAIANYNLSLALHDSGCHIDLLAMNTAKHYVNHDEARKNLSQYEKIDIIDIDTQLSISGLLKSFMRKSSYHIDRFEKDEVADAIARMIQRSEYDIIQLESIYTAPYIEVIRKHSSAKIVLRAHNVEHQIWQRLAQQEKNPLKKVAMKSLARRLKAYELDAIKQVEVLTTVSSLDKDYFNKYSSTTKTIYHPIGIDTANYKRNSASANSQIIIGFIGSMDWRPNIEGVEWFLAEVWPAIIGLYPDMGFHIAGRNMTAQQIQRYEQGTSVTAVGEVEDALDFMNACHVLITPLFSGSGMRVKIIEAMALAKPVVTTSIGVEGIDAAQGVEVLIANTATDFIRSLKELLDQPAYREEIGLSAKSFVLKNFDIDQLTRKLIVDYLNL